MINLKDYVVKIEGEKYVPLDIAKKAVKAQKLKEVNKRLKSEHDIAVKAANNAVDNLVKKISSKHEQLDPNRNKSNDDIITASL